MDQITKELQRLTEKERKAILVTMQQIEGNMLSGLDVKKLHGRDDIFRVRKGKFRIMFMKRNNKEPVILSLERRSDTTYNQ